ncbi:MAG: hypothetical protein JO263_02300, partial [Candidatus Eremiobacteraeota bacterium]|nr:hypothetical protein [Candidatus Eremiobacteraeota bacterium]
MNLTNRISFLRDTKSIDELNARYDLIVDKEGRLSRVQVKTGRLR